MIDFIIPERYYYHPVFTVLWILLVACNFVLYHFTSLSLVPRCERLILHHSPGDSAHRRRDARTRSKVYALISAIGISHIITHSFGLVGGILYSVSAAEYTSSSRLAISHACCAVLTGLSWMVIAFCSLSDLLRLVQMAKKHSGAEAGVMEGLSSVMEEKEMEKGGMVVRCVECASRVRRSSV